MPRKPTTAQLIRCIAQQEALTKTRDCFPGLSDKSLRTLLWQAAAALEANATLPLEETLGPPENAEEGEGPAPPLPPPIAGPSLLSLEEASPASLAKPAPSALFSSHTFLRIYSDGASRGNPGPAGAGALLVDAGGQTVERLGLFLGEQTNNHAEYQGALLGLRAARARGAREVELLADSQLLVFQLQGRYRVRNPGLWPLYQEAKALLAQFSKVRLRHIPREENREADAMSNEAIDKRLGG